MFAKTVKAIKEPPMAMTFQRNIGFVVLGIWLILHGLVGMMNLMIPLPMMSALALMAGVLILAGR
jgi:hypothetical protein